MSKIVDFRHGLIIDKAERVLKAVNGDTHYILIVHDGADIPKPLRRASYVADSCIEDVRAILKELANNV